ncbi:MAG TPA: glycosyltransferase family 2 protein, partial [Pyrinomonadaceae bacterium]
MSNVSVIITTCARPRMLARCVESVRAAASSAVEIVVVDDASSGETAEVCRRVGGVRYVRLERRLSAAAARNVGLLASTGEYVLFLEDEDRRLPGSIDRQVAKLEENPAAGFCCGPLLGADVDVLPACEAAFWPLLRLDFFVQPVGVVARRGAILAAGLLKTDIGRIDVWDLCVRLAELFPVVKVD